MRTTNEAIITKVEKIGGQFILTVACPNDCGKAIHQHGGGFSSAADVLAYGLGNRVPHCSVAADRPGYHLVDDEGHLSRMTSNPVQHIAALLTRYPTAQEMDNSAIRIYTSSAANYFHVSISEDRGYIVLTVERVQTELDVHGEMHRLVQQINDDVPDFLHRTYNLGSLANGAKIAVRNDKRAHLAVRRIINSERERSVHWEHVSKAMQALLDKTGIESDTSGFASDRAYELPIVRRDLPVATQRFISTIESHNLSAQRGVGGRP